LTVTDRANNSPPGMMFATLLFIVLQDDLGPYEETALQCAA
jgi:hypothetical protein